MARTTYKERTGFSRQWNWMLRKQQREGKARVVPVEKPCWYCVGGTVHIYPDGLKPPQCFKCNLEKD